MDAQLREAIRALGSQLSPAVVMESCRIAAGRLDPALNAGISCERDIPYGPDERHRLDLFSKLGNEARRPVLVFAHGGGFVGGNKSLKRQPFYDNIGYWAAQKNWVGITLNYRLAPKYPWPSGAQDIGRAVEWIRGHVESFSGDPERIFLMGQSAGAVHAGNYIASPEFHAASGRGLAGGILLSAIYDVAAADPNDFQKAYYGADAGVYSTCSSLPGLIETDLPLLLSISEFDELDFQKQAEIFVETYMKRHGRYAPMLYLAGHNHISNVLLLGSADDTLGPEIELFVSSQSIQPG